MIGRKELCPVDPMFVVCLLITFRLVIWPGGKVKFASVDSIQRLPSGPKIMLKTSPQRESKLISHIGVIWPAVVILSISPKQSPNQSVPSDAEIMFCGCGAEGAWKSVLGLVPMVGIRAIEPLVVVLVTQSAPSGPEVMSRGYAPVLS